MGHLKVIRFVFICGLWAATALGVAAQEPRPSPLLPAKPPTTVAPVLMPFPTAAGDSPELRDDVEILPLPTPTPIYGRLGMLVETLDGQAIRAESSEQLFNPASAIKLATALDALQTFGPEHRFATVLWTNGTLDQATGTIAGDLIVSGRDPSFHDEHAVELARELNRLGIRIVTGDLIVAPRFTLNFSSSSQRSGERLYDTLDAERRPASATRAWYDSRIVRGQQATLPTVPSVAVMGAVYVESVPAGARMLLTHRSSALVDVLKVLLCYSNNFMAERLGDTMGGPAGLQQFLISKVGVSPFEVQLATTSGLGVNRVSPRAMMKIYRALVAELDRHDLTPADILPVAGVDPGTLQKRFTAGLARASVIAKTGTLIRTDAGASALVGQLRTRNGETLLFVIFNQRGSVWRFRNMQEQLISEIQFARGGPAPFAYTPVTLAMRLADTETKATRNSDEYEATPN